MARSDSERAKVRRVANQRFLTAMLDMGVPQDQAELALAETGNVGVEVRSALRLAWRRAAALRESVMWSTPFKMRISALTL